MDAREALRRYLEQRRELGESELVLDSMTVDEALALLGAANVRAGAAPRKHSGAPTPTARQSIEDVPATADWREAIRAAGGGPERSVQPERATPDAANEPMPKRETKLPAAPSQAPAA